MPLRPGESGQEVWGQPQHMPLGLPAFAPATFPGPTEPSQQGRWQGQRRAGQLPGPSAPVGQAEPPGLSVHMHVRACECVCLVSFLLGCCLEKCPT